MQIYCRKGQPKRVVGELTTHANNRLGFRLRERGLYYFRDISLSYGIKEINNDCLNTTFIS